MSYTLFDKDIFLDDVDYSREPAPTLVTAPFSMTGMRFFSYENVKIDCQFNLHPYPRWPLSATLGGKAVLRTRCSQPRDAFADQCAVSGYTELPQGVGQPGFPCVLVGVGAGAECVASTPL
jgi:hypothetical protein